MTKEIRVTFEDVIRMVDIIVNPKYDLPQDNQSIKDRLEFTKQVYYTYIREVKADNTLYLDYIDSALQGNLAHWYANTLSYEQKAPIRYRGDVIHCIEELFKNRYTWC